MLSRREILLASSAAVVAGVTSLDAWAAPGLPGHADRELKLKISDGFASQQWRSAGQTRLETAKRLTLFEGETVSITILNDTAGDRFVTWGADIMCRLVRKGAETTLTFHVEKAGKYNVGLLSDKGVTDELPADIVAKPRAQP